MQCSSHSWPEGVNKEPWVAYLPQKKTFRSSVSAAGCQCSLRTYCCRIYDVQWPRSARCLISSFIQRTLYIGHHSRTTESNLEFSFQHEWTRRTAAQEAEPTTDNNRRFTAAPIQRIKVKYSCLVSIMKCNNLAEDNIITRCRRFK